MGALTVESEPTEPLSEADRDLIRHLAGGLGIVLKNLGLRVDLEHRIEELTSSRLRLVEAADTARRGVEQQLERGAVAELVSIGSEVGALAADVEHAGGEQSAKILEVAAADAQVAVDGIRSFARGVYPPALERDGLPAALRAVASGMAIPVTVHAPGVGRLPRDVEVALYFTALEALQNAVKYAEASSTHVQLVLTVDGLLLEVSDDGRGFDMDHVVRGAGLTNMGDRVDALGGRIEFATEPGRGTTVRAVVPHGSER